VGTDGTNLTINSFDPVMVKQHVEDLRVAVEAKRKAA